MLWILSLSVLLYVTPSSPFTFTSHSSLFSSSSSSLSSSLSSSVSSPSSFFSFVDSAAYNRRHDDLDFDADESDLDPDDEDENDNEQQQIKRATNQMQEDEEEDEDEDEEDEEAVLLRQRQAAAAAAASAKHKNAKKSSSSSSPSSSSTSSSSPSTSSTSSPSFGFGSLLDNHDNYFFEIFAISFSFLYILFFFIGSSRNSSIASSFLATHRPFLSSQFASLSSYNPASFPSSLQTKDGFYYDSYSLFKLYCSGRRYITGCMIELQLMRRQDLFSVLLSYIDVTQKKDIIQFEFHMNTEEGSNSNNNTVAGEMGDWMLFICKKRQEKKMKKYHKDLDVLASVVKNTKMNSLIEKGTSSSSSSSNSDGKEKEKNSNAERWSVLSDNNDVDSEFLSDSVVRTLNKYEHLIVDLHITDQYAPQYSPYETDEQTAERDRAALASTDSPSTNTGLVIGAGEGGRLVQPTYPVTRKLIRFRFYLPTNPADEAGFTTLLQLCFQLVDAAAVFRLSPVSAVKNWQKRKKLQEIVEKERVKERRELLIKQKRENEKEKDGGKARKEKEDIKKKKAANKVKVMR